MNNTPKKTLLSWSSGKDSAWALHVLRQSAAHEVVGLVTTVNAEFQRVAMHGVRRELLEAQAAAAGLPLEVLELPWPCSNEQYEAVMAAWVKRAVAAGVECMAFGDLFLEEVRTYRERMLSGTGLTPVFPIWDSGRDTAALAQTMVAAGLRAHLSCVDPRALPRDFAGRVFDETLLADLPAQVDPCGERGEFHSFAFAGPMFSRPLALRTGEVVERDGFIFCDLVLS